MDSDVISFAVVAVVIVFMVASLSGILVWMMRALKRKAPAPELPNPLYEQRLDQLQQSVDAIAVEVERIAEAQRFSAKLLKERSDSPALPR
jgi:hypothetical protein